MKEYRTSNHKISTILGKQYCSDIANDSTPHCSHHDPSSLQLELNNLNHCCLATGNSELGLGSLLLSAYMCQSVTEEYH